MSTYIDWSLISKSFREDLSGNEQRQLNEWLDNSEAHRIFYERASRGGVTDPGIGVEFGVLQEKKKVLFRRIDVKKIRRRKLILRRGGYAALFLLVLGITMLLKSGHEITIEKNKPAFSQLPALPPGTTRATLTLADGRQVILDSIGRQLVSDGGAKIQSTNNTLIYSESKSNVPVYNTISIPRGGEYQVILSDGTKVWINSYTEIRYPVAFSPVERVVYLSGEAYFEVKKDKRPFKVMVNDLQIKVYGTSFNVNAYDKRMVETTLVEGNVGLCHRGAKQEIRLKPSEQARYQVDKSIIDIQQVNVYDFIAWKNGEFVFNDQTIEEIMKRLSVWYDIEVKYENDVVKKRKFTGIMQRYATIDKILYYIQETATINFTANDREIIVK